MGVCLLLQCNVNIISINIYCECHSSGKIFLVGHSMIHSSGTVLPLERNLFNGVNDPRISSWLAEVYGKST